MKDQFQVHYDSKIIKMTEFCKCTATLYQSMQRSLTTQFEQKLFLNKDSLLATILVYLMYHYNVSEIHSRERANYFLRNKTS